mmetsp:Transcript_24039/g.69403  ORF Transcript_24039/g.69403 Transcript_24039/m.69403 type:complete len:268 (-) Transcript_24039:1132-1935(-)
MFAGFRRPQHAPEDGLALGPQCTRMTGMLRFAFRVFRRVGEVGLHITFALQLNLPAEFDIKRRIVRHVVVGLLSKLQAADLTLLHHPGRGVDGVAKEPVARKPLTEDARDNRPRVHAHLELHRLVLQPEHLLHGHHEPPQDLRVPGSLALPHVLWHYAHTADILLTDGLDLCHPVGLAYLIKLCELLVEESQHLRRCQPIGNPVEIINDHEEHRRSVHLLRDDFAWLLYHRHNYMSRHHVLEDLEELPACSPEPEFRNESQPLHVLE